MKYLSLALVSLALMAPAPALAAAPDSVAEASSPTSVEAPAAPRAREVEPQSVCMVTDRRFGTDQIPVEAEGKTYYGCCQMCKKTLTQSAETRVAVDPVSGKSVDKASAVIGTMADGSVRYFENQDTLRRFNEKTDS